MAILKDALQGIWHHKVRSFLVLAICFTVAAESFQLFSMSAGTGAYLDGYRQKMMTEVCIRFTYSSKTAKDASGWRIATPIDSATLAKLAALPHVKGHNYATYRGTQIQSIIDFFNKNPEIDYEAGNIAGRQGTYDNDNPSNPYQFPLAVVDCVSDTSKLGEFTYGGYKISAGRGITEADKDRKVIVVPSTLAKELNWKVGDKVTLSGSFKKQGTIDTTVIGVADVRPNYSQKIRSNSFFIIKPVNNPCFIGTNYCENIIYAPFDMMDNAFWEDQWKPGDAEIAYFYIDDLKNVHSFTAQAKKLVDPKLYSISVNSTKAFDRLVGGPDRVLRNLQGSATLPIVTGCAAILLICLLSTLRRRGSFELLLKKNTGRKTIAAGVVLETLLLVLVPFIIAAFIHGSYLFDTGLKMVKGFNDGSRIGHPIDAVSENVIMGQYIPENTIDSFGELKSAVTPAAVGEYALLGFGIFAGASVLSAAYVFTFRVRGKKDEPASAEEQPQRTEQNIKN